ncbi:MAG: hypothetical protein WBW92_08850, partial [Rhodanobacteraceae bacterium]
PVTIAIYDPELYGGVLASGLPAADEMRGATYGSSTFFVVAQSTGTTIASKTYPAGSSATNGLWDQIITFVPTPGETYEIHATVDDDDENAWRARVSYDPDCAVGTGTCTAAQLDNGNEVSDFDTESGTGDELLINPIRSAYQHDQPNACNNHYFFVDETVGSVTMRNFDLDDGGTIVYTRADGSTVNGTASGNGVWAYDTVPVGPGQAGWWHVQFCYTPTNLYVFESTQNMLLYMDTLPGAPELAITKNDGVSVVEWGDTLNYTINVHNVSDANVNPGKAFNVVVTDDVPTGLTYESCFMGGAAGSCSESGGVVTWTLTDGLSAGEDVDLGITATVDWWNYDPIVNTAVADYDDAYGNNYPDVSATDDVNTVEPPSFVVTKTSDAGGALVDPGQTVDYTVVVQNPTSSTHTNVVIGDTMPAGMTYVPGSTVVQGPAGTASFTASDDFSSGTYTGGSGWSTAWTEISDDGVTTTGDVYYATSGADAGQAVWMRQPGNGLQRTVNVTDATAATLKFDLWAPNPLEFEATDYFEWGVSVDGGAFQQLGSDYGAPTPNPRTI